MLLVLGGVVIAILRVLRRFGIGDAYGRVLAWRERTQDTGGSASVGLGSLAIGLAGEWISVSTILGGSSADIFWGVIGALGFLMFLVVGIGAVVILIIDHTRSERGRP
jgi:hypothetical protein